MTIRYPRRLSVASTRNSECSAPMSLLDFARWFTDHSFDSHYLHVWSRDGETIHRVRCKYTDKPRLEYVHGKLYWLVDKP